ncbi:MAG: hypothetical protein ACW99Q_26090, partial [Candidatus Kariarchaeaceae archaeon]
GSDHITNLHVDVEQNILLSGYTSSSDFPIEKAYDDSYNGDSESQDGFLSKFSSDGQSLLFSSFFGGSDIDYITKMKEDPMGNIIIIGGTDSQDFRLLNAFDGSYGGNTDGFIAKFSSDGQSLLFSTFLGGSGIDRILNIMIDSMGDIIVSGETASQDFPVINTFDAGHNRINGPEAFLSKFSVNGQVIFSSFFGGLLEEKLDFDNNQFLMREGSMEAICISGSIGIGALLDGAYLIVFNLLDFDGDGMSNQWEIEMGLDPSYNDAQADFDDDGLPNLWEYQMGLNASLNDANEDKDGDLMPNYWEYQMGLNAAVNDSTSDFDGDGMPNLYEYRMGLNASFNDANYDKDGDLVTNYSEYLSNTDPTDFWSVPLLYSEFPYFISAQLIFVITFLLIGSFTGYLGGSRLKKYQQERLIIEMGAPDYKTAMLMKRGKFTDYETYQKAQKLNISSLEEYEFELEIIKTLEEETK